MPTDELWCWILGGIAVVFLALAIWDLLTTDWKTKV